MSDDVRSVFLEAATRGAALIGHPEVRDAWSAPSALDCMTVGDLAAHLARAGFLVQVYLENPPTAATGTPGPEVDACSYFLAFEGLTDPESQLSQGVRSRAREGSVEGHAAVAERAERAVAELRSVLPGLPADQRITVKDGLVLTLDEYLKTRLVELAVHEDDLRSSLPGLPVVSDDVPDGVMDDGGTDGVGVAARRIAIDVLVGVAVQRHGGTAVLRALARRERDDVSALRVF